MTRLEGLRIKLDKYEVKKETARREGNYNDAFYYQGKVSATLDEIIYRLKHEENVQH